MSRVLNLLRTAVEWTTANPVLGAGQVGVEKSTNKFKVGNGLTHWVDLRYGSQLNVKSVVATLDFANMAAGASSELTVTVTGAAVGDVVAVGPPAGVEAGVCWNGYVSAADTVKVRLSNVTASAINPASAAWTVKVLS